VSAIFDLADGYVVELAGREAYIATLLGAPGHEEDMTDHSPAGVEAQAELSRRTLRELRGTEAENDAERICREFMIERLQVDLDMHETGESWRMVRNLGSPIQQIRQIFDLCPRETEDDWRHIAARLAKVAGSVAGLEATLRRGLDLGLPAARRQALVCAKQAAVWGGETADGSPFFLALVQQCPHGGSLRADLAAAARSATEAYAGLARYLRDEYAPAAPDRDPVGGERYRLASRAFLGSEVDPEETYAWGWEEMHRLEDEIGRVADRITPGAGCRRSHRAADHRPGAGSAGG
jgi:uncharacterized protein (DUF885 family)